MSGTDFPAPDSSTAVAGAAAAAAHPPELACKAAALEARVVHQDRAHVLVEMGHHLPGMAQRHSWRCLKVRMEVAVAAVRTVVDRKEDGWRLQKSSGSCRVLGVGRRSTVGEQKMDSEVEGWNRGRTMLEGVAGGSRKVGLHCVAEGIETGPG